MGTDGRDVRPGPVPGKAELSSAQWSMQAALATPLPTCGRSSRSSLGPSLPTPPCLTAAPALVGGSAWPHCSGFQGSGLLGDGFRWCLSPGSRRLHGAQHHPRPNSASSLHPPRSGSGGEQQHGPSSKTGPGFRAVEGPGLGVNPVPPCEGRYSSVSCIGDVGHRRPTTAIAAPAATPAATAHSSPAATNLMAVTAPDGRQLPSTPG